MFWVHQTCKHEYAAYLVDLYPLERHHIKKMKLEQGDNLELFLTRVTEKYLMQELRFNLEEVHNLLV